jgi:hypothetical protein
MVQEMPQQASERIGQFQEDGINRQWARRGTKSSAPQDQRYALIYIFGAVCPRDRKRAALELPFCHTAAMNLHLAEIREMVGPARHAVLLLDPAGTFPVTLSCQTTSHCFHCHRNVQS